MTTCATGAAELVLAERRKRPGLGDRHANPDRRLRLRDRRDRPRQRRDAGDGEDLPCVAHGRWLHGGVGKRGWLAASSSGQTITFLPSCH